MTNTDPTSHLRAQHHATLRRAARARSQAEQNLRVAILAAREAGLTAREIGESVELTHTRVLQIEREAREREGASNG